MTIKKVYLEYKKPIYASSQTFITCFIYIQSQRCDFCKELK